MRSSEVEATAAAGGGDHGPHEGSVVAWRLGIARRAAVRRQVWAVTLQLCGAARAILSLHQQLREHPRADSVGCIFALLAI